MPECRSGLQSSLDLLAIIAPLGIAMQLSWLLHRDMGVTESPGHHLLVGCTTDLPHCRCYNEHVHLPWTSLTGDPLVSVLLPSPVGPLLSVDTSSCSAKSSKLLHPFSCPAPYNKCLINYISPYSMSILTPRFPYAVLTLLTMAGHSKFFLSSKILLKFPLEILPGTQEAAISPSW